MSIRRSNKRDSFVGSQILERRRMLWAAMDGRELSGLFGTERAIEESIVVNASASSRSNSSSSSAKTDSRVGQTKAIAPKLAAFDSSRVITPRDGSFVGSNPTTSKGPESNPVELTGTPNADTIVISISGPSILVEINGVSSFFSDTFFDSVMIDGLGGADTINVESNGANPTTVRGGAGGDMIALSLTGGDLDSIAAPVVVEGGVDGATLSLFDDANGFSDTYTMTNSTLTRDFFGGVTYSDLTS
ncbi:MAG TPA: hypothetical protein PK402_08055, partial [Tepidisphaeraceae bacterium]|nr:hypothetical protein [Tepidisphaeraceae bacterium]